MMTGAAGPSCSLDCYISLCGCSNSHQHQVTVCHDAQDPAPILVTGYLATLCGTGHASTRRSTIDTTQSTSTNRKTETVISG